MRSSILVFRPFEQWSQPAGLVETKLKSQLNPNFCSGRLLAQLSFVGYRCWPLTFLSGQRERTDHFPEWMIPCKTSYASLSHPCFLFYFFFPQRKSMSVNQSNFLLSSNDFVINSWTSAASLCRLGHPAQWVPASSSCHFQAEGVQAHFLVGRVNRITKCQNALSGWRQTLLCSDTFVESVRLAALHPGRVGWLGKSYNGTFLWRCHSLGVLKFRQSCQLSPWFCIIIPPRKLLYVKLKWIIPDFPISFLFVPLGGL